MADKKIPQPLEKLSPDRDTRLYIDQSHYRVIDNCCGAIEGTVSAMRPVDEVAGLAEALHLAWDKITDILGEVERQECKKLLGGGQ